jgi:hypothetical protein
VHLPHRVASAGRGTKRYDAVDFRKIVCGQQNIRRAHILFEVLARFRTWYRYDEGSHMRPLGHWPSDGELRQRGVLPPRDGLETAERVLTRVGKTPPATRTTSAAAAETKATTASRGRGRPSRAAVSKSARSKPSAPSLGERVLALATGRTRQELYLACPNDRPNHIGISVQRHLRAGRIQERDGKLYATSPAAHATA